MNTKKEKPPDIIFSKKENFLIGNCPYFEKKTLDILNGNYKKYIFIEFDGKIIGHINLKGEKNFLSYVNFTNKNGEIVLVKGCIYAIEGYKKITEKTIKDFSLNNIFKINGNLEVKYLRPANFGSLEKLDLFLKSIKKK